MNVAFLANSFHLRKTKSADFFISQLEQWYDQIAVIPHKEVWSYLPKKRWDLLIWWQRLPSRSELECFRAQTTVLVPMFDDCSKDETFWRQYQGVKILCFSRTLAQLLRQWDLDVLNVQYWQAPAERGVSFHAGLKGFFWPRSSDYTWEGLRSLLDGANWASFHLHLTGSFSQLELNQGDREKYRLEISSWFEQREDYVQALEAANVFFVPRPYEGIGQATLEALSLGMYVVAPDLPTNNEYIRHQVNGWLYDPEHPLVPDWSRAQACGEQARNDAKVGWQKWTDGLETLRSFLEKPSPGLSFRWHPVLATQQNAIVWLRFIFRFAKRLMRRLIQALGSQENKNTHG